MEAMRPATPSMKEGNDPYSLLFEDGFHEEGFERIAAIEVDSFHIVWLRGRGHETREEGNPDRVGYLLGHLVRTTGADSVRKRSD